MAGTDYKVIFELGDLPGDRICLLLEAIDRAGSINRAAGELKVSYRHAWGLIKKAEERLSAPLLQKRVGGAEGGGAELTDAARALLEKYRQFRREVTGRLGPIFTPTAGPDAGGPDRGTEAAAPVLLAGTIGPIESGLMGALEERFYQRSGILVRHIAAGTGQALSIAREGRADLVLTHAPELEAAFVAEGFGAGRFPLMYNDFLLLGPAADPAGVKDAASAPAAFRQIARAGAAFISRGDRSGTHVKELALWSLAEVTPAAPWYQVCEQGAMGSLATLRFAEAAGAYTLVDRAAFLTAREGRLDLAVLLTGDPVLRNEFALVPVSPERFPRAAHAQAQQFVAWATSPDGQQLIAEFGVNRFGEPLFFSLVQG
ncbi:MAG TPA: substrate-binding domain-containing protein [Symbiobacteriaceae bacterium]